MVAHVIRGPSKTTPMFLVKKILGNAFLPTTLNNHKEVLRVARLALAAAGLLPTQIRKQ
jgi:hypothetical protein